MSKSAPLAVTYLDPERLVPHPKNPRPESAFKKSNPHMQELIKSITAHDVLQPITVRKVGEQFQVVAGHRRFYAAKHAGKKVPALVRDLDDASALALMLAENIQREDADPIMEARTIGVLLEEGRGLEDIASRFGKSYSWAVKRAQLANLSPKWLEAQVAGEIDWSIDLLVIIARYAPEAQDVLYDVLVKSWTDYTVETLTHALGSYHHDITKTQWNPDDADLLPEAGACSACPKRASCQQTLFDEIKVTKKGPDHCTDHVCWEKKATRHMERQLVTLKEKHGVEIARVSVMQSRPEDKTIIGSFEFERTKKTDPKARLAIITDGPQQGAAIWIKEVSSRQSGPTTAAKVAREAGKEPTRKELRAELEEKRTALAKRRVLDAWHNLLRILMAIKPNDKGKTPWRVDGKHIAMDGGFPEVTSTKANEETGSYPLPQGKVPSTNAMLPWIIMHGVRAVRVATSGGLEAQQLLTTEKLHQHAMLWSACFQTLKEELERAIAMRDLAASTPEEIATLIEVDLAHLVKQSTEAIKEPKAWEVQYGDLLKN